MSEFIVSGNRFQGRELAPGLYLVSTPIGNLGDITLRALETLAGADLVACEDTRVTGNLLRHFAIKAKLAAYHEHNTAKAGPRLLAMLKQGARVALATDAGTPLVSDPGFRLVAAAREAAIPVWPVPGASAPIAALVASGMPAERFLFDGFLPARTKARRERLALLKTVPASLLFFESPNRLSACLQDMAGEMGAQRVACICRELTKLHEEVRCGQLGELAQAYRDIKVRGEIVLVVAPPPETAPEIDSEAVLTGLLETMSVSRAAAEAADLTGMPKRELYAVALKLARRLQSP